MEIYSYSVTVRKPTSIDYGVYENDLFLKQLIAELSLMFGIDSRQLYERDRSENVRYCRWIVWEIMWATKNLTLKETAKIAGTYDHTSVIHAFDTLPSVFEDKPFVKSVYDTVVKRLGIDFRLIVAARKKRVENPVKEKSLPVFILPPVQTGKKPLTERYLKQKLHKIYNQRKTA